MVCQREGDLTLAKEGRAAHPGCSVSTVGINRNSSRTNCMLTLACGQLAGMRQEPQRSSQTPAEKLLHVT